MREARELLDTQMGDAAGRRIDDEVRKGLDGYDKALVSAIAKAEEAVFRRFDTMVATLLGDGAPEGQSMEAILGRAMGRAQMLASVASGREPETPAAPGGDNEG